MDSQARPRCWEGDLFLKLEGGAFAGRGRQEQERVMLREVAGGGGGADPHPILNNGSVEYAILEKVSLHSFTKPIFCGEGKPGERKAGLHLC